MKFYSHILFALFASSLYGDIRSENVACYECPDLSHPRDCTKTVDCGPNQLCYVRRYSTHDGHIYYNSGCLSREQCHDDHGILVGRQVSGSHHLECSACCNGNFCNTNLCETHPVNSTRKRCMSCDSVDHVEDCQTVQGCHADEMCYTTRYLNTFGEKRFRLGCTNIKGCVHGGNSLIGEFQYCSKCCSHDHCNRALCKDPTTAPVPTSTLSTVCEDDPTKPCISSLLSSICSDSQFSQFCKRSCGLCDPTTPPTTSSTPSPVCDDDPSRHCYPSILSLLCADSVLSQFCKKSCGLCGKHVFCS
ncbi:ly6/PLAUR domain-containing protein 8-like [Argopecten irradians]|uniref:ly6/PLAUR domain-containing protein 8-like n=1 Tax=Argopecten irradians TaxID=31199 RepID=UPI00371F6B1A